MLTFPCISGPQDRAARIVFTAVLLSATWPQFVARSAETAPEQSSSSASRPNVILIVTDDQGYGDIGFHGNSIVKTPNLDRLASQSLRLIDFHVDPTCSPTRAALMTGRYSCRTGVWHTIMGRSILRGDETTMAEYFARAGYATAMFGKWHLGDNAPYRPIDRGFQHALCHGGGGIGQTPDYWGNTYFSPMLRNDGNWEPSQGYCTDVFFAGAREFIAQHRDHPFFVYLPTNVPHGPWQVDDRYAAPYRAAGVSKDLANFYGMLTNFDENLGGFLASLDEWDLARNTLVIFMTDNGTAGNGFNAGMRGRKGSPYDGGHRVPCFLRWPDRWSQPRDVPGLTAHIDLLPTLIELCNLPKEGGMPLDGVSLCPILDGKSGGDPDRTIFVQVNRIEHPVPWRLSSVLTPRYRLINGNELYDIVEDPGQNHDIASAQPDLVQQLRSRYEGWYRDVSSRFGEYVPLVLGTAQENPALLTCHDWHGEKIPWDQTMISRGADGNGFWAVEFSRSGEYRITLRDRPPYVSHPLAGRRARLVIGDQEWVRDIPPGAQAVEFRVNQAAGPTRVQTFLMDGDTELRGAYFVEVAYLDGEASSEAEPQSP
ncbi:MAG: arylsulfatase [Thermogutta sp.]